MFLGALLQDLISSSYFPYVFYLSSLASLFFFFGEPYLLLSRSSFNYYNFVTTYNISAQALKF